MATWRQGLVFVLGCVLGIFAGALALMSMHRAPSPTVAQQQALQVPSADAGPACTFDALLPPTGGKDGQFAMPGDVTDKTTTDVTAYLTVGADAARQGRVRDGEVAYITACRIAAQVTAADSVEVGESKYQLARHYTTVAAGAPGPDALRGEVLRRAQELFGQSMAIASVKYGAAHEKTRLAAAGLVMARQAGALSAQLASAAEPAAAASHAAAAASAASAPASAAKVAVAEVVKKKPVVRRREPDETDTASAAPAARPRAVPQPATPNTTEVGGPPASTYETTPARSYDTAPVRSSDAAPARPSAARPEFGDQIPQEAGMP